ncbi:hypothetical protein A5765_09000 [Mycolicibacterium celeriflavum]|nr:hypothetical protein A5765_09000 [Mycolicibacterium celeriflavum]ORA42863.1 hypothetical protein BST21_22780 [Mycolicibacterium celeriflavum]
MVCVGAAGCDASGPAPDASAPRLPAFTTSQAQPAPTASPTGDAAPKGGDYSGLLLRPEDLSDAEDTFAVRSTTPGGPDGLPGASALFVNQDDTRAISDAIVIYPDAATAATTLREALPTIGTVVTGATSRPVPVGSDGTMAVGMSPDGTKAATLLLFTQGPALVRLEFESAPGDATTDEFVINIGKMQQIALRTGLSRSQ